MVGRVVALIALVAVVVAVALAMLGGGEDYKITATFENASQLVGGEQVVIGGTPVGTTSAPTLASDGQAEVEFTVNDDYSPLPTDTVATIRSFSLSGIANRQIQLTLPPDNTASEETIEDGGVLPQSQTIAEVDLDQLFNTLDDETVADFKKVIQGFALSYEGVESQANQGIKYFNPFLSTSRRVFAELNRDQSALEGLIVDGARLTGALAERRDDVSALVGNLNRMMGALGRRRTELAATINKLPDFMRNFNTTAVNLRTTLDDVDPLIDATKPVAIKLRPFFRQLRGASADLVPAIRDLDDTISAPGKINDLVELTNLQVPLAKIAVRSARRNGEIRDGALPASTDSLRNSLEQLGFFRAYTPELVGWFDDFGRSGTYDANGGIGRIATSFNFFSAGVNGLPLVNDLFNPGGSVLSPTDVLSMIDTDNLRKCPGANERPAADGSNPFTDGGTINCDPTDLPLNP